MRDATLQFSKNDYGDLFECSSSGSMALVRPASPFLTDNVVIQFDVVLQAESKRNGALGFAFRYESSSNFYRFEWQVDEGCASIVHYQGRFKRREVAVLKSVTGHRMIQNQYYHITISLLAAKIDVNVRGVNRNGLSVQSRDEFTLSAIDPDYRVSRVFVLQLFLLLLFVTSFYCFFSGSLFSALSMLEWTFCV